MASPRSELRRWQLVLDVPGEPSVTFAVGKKDDAGAVVDAIRDVLRRLCARGGCRSLTIGVHVEGAECDHELGGAG